MAAANRSGQSPKRCKRLRVEVDRSVLGSCHTHPLHGWFDLLLPERDQPTAPQVTLGWGRRSVGVILRRIPGIHSDIVIDPMPELARAMRDCLEPHFQGGGDGHV